MAIRSALAGKEGKKAISDCSTDSKNDRQTVDEVSNNKNNDVDDTSDNEKQKLTNKN